MGNFLPWRIVPENEAAAWTPVWYSRESDAISDPIDFPVSVTFRNGLIAQGGMPDYGYVKLAESKLFKPETSDDPENRPQVTVKEQPSIFKPNVSLLKGGIDV